MFDFMSQIFAQMKAQDRFGGGSQSDAVPAVSHSPFGPAPMTGPTGGAVPGVVSPAAETVLDERESYLANSAGFDAKWANDSLLSRALARHRGEKVEDPAIQPERGAPGQERPQRDIATIIAEAMASAAKPASGPAPERERPYTGLSPEEEYHQRRAALDARAGSQPHREASRPELGAPGQARPLRDPATVIAEAMASATRPASGPAPGPERPYTGLSPEEEYHQRRAAIDARAARR